MALDEMELRKNNLEHQETLEVAPDFGVENEAGQGIETEQKAAPESETIAPVGTPAPVSAPQPIAKDPVVATVESILTENLGDLYLSLPADEQQKFKAKGEETSKKIVELLRSAKATFKKIFNLIFDWLKTIPGINKFFTEQEAKIKADKIMKI
jgi:hypothetical protein